MSLNKEKINELAQKVQKWDTEAFWKIYDILIQNIYSFIFYKVSHKETAEDLSEEVFVKVWDKILKQGKEIVYEHAIKGFNAMPPKGGDMSLSDKSVKEIVDYMINHNE